MIHYACGIAAYSYDHRSDQVIRDAKVFGLVVVLTKGLIKPAY